MQRRAGARYRVEAAHLPASEVHVLLAICARAVVLEASNTGKQGVMVRRMLRAAPASRKNTGHRVLLANACSSCVPRTHTIQE